MNLYCDNKVAINIAHNPVQHDQTKHIEINCHFIKGNIMYQQICIPFVKMDKQPTNLLTKINILVLR